MNIQYTQKNTNFHGYDARPLKGFVMNSNYAGIADEIKHIGEIEKFKVYLFENIKNEFKLKTDCFQKTNNNKGCWAQDYWGIIKDKLLIDETSDKSEFLKKVFCLGINLIQDTIREIMKIPEMYEYMDLLYNLPVVNKNGKEFIEILTPDGKEYIDKVIYDIEFAKNEELLKKALNQTHIKGGNYFLTQNKDGNNELLIGENELKKFDIDTIKQIFLTDNVHIIPQADFHLDLFIRPLKDKKVLLADDNMMLDEIKKAIKELTQHIVKTPVKERNKYKDAFINLNIYAKQFEEIMRRNPYAKTDEVEKALLDGGYEPIRVPARIFELYGDDSDNKVNLKQLHNYINANVLINDKNELVYITNRSNLDEKLGLTEEIKRETGISIEDTFIKYAKRYIDKIYFVSGENNEIAKQLLPEQGGAIHCMCMEIPQ